MPKIINTSATYVVLIYFLTALLAALSLSGCGGGGGEETAALAAPGPQAVTLNSLSVTAVESALKVDQTFQLNVTGTYSNATTQDLTSLVTWSVANATVLEISGAGLVTALAAGTTAVTGAYEGVSIERNISVKALEALSISPTTLTLAVASSKQLSVIGRYTDNSTEVFDSAVTWESSGANVVSVLDSGLVLGIAEGAASVTAIVDAVSSSLSVQISAATLQSIVVNAETTQIPSGLKATFWAKGIYSDGTEQNLSDQVMWSVSDTSIASISAETGLLTALQAGGCSVIASKEGLSSSLIISVSPASVMAIAISPSIISLAKGSSDHVEVSAILSDGTKLDVSDQVEWLISNTQIASIGDGSKVLALTDGSAALSASLSGQQASLLVNVTDAELVSLLISPINASIPLGQSVQYYAQGTFSDGTVQDLTSEVTWLSSNEEQVLLTNTESLAGLAESITLGNSMLTAVLGDIQQNTQLSVTNAMLSSIHIQPASQLVAVGSKAKIKALGFYTDGSLLDLTSKVIWSSSDASLIDVLSASTGSVLSIDEGSALISAELEGVSGLGYITVSAATLQSIVISTSQTVLPSGTSEQLLATGTYSDMSTKDLSQQVSWQSDDVQIAAVSNTGSGAGVLSAISPGQLTISASLGSLSDQINVAVTDATLTSVQVTTTSLQINVASSAKFTATASFSDSSTLDVSSQVNWLSSNVNIASIGNAEFDKGLVNALSAGSVNISASLSGINSSPLELQVSLNPNLLKALNVSVQPNIILNDSNDAAQVNLVLVPSAHNGVIADGTAITLTINEGSSIREVNLVTTNGEVSYSLRSSYAGFISLSVAVNDLSANAGVLSTDTLTDAFLTTGLADGVYENNTLRAGSTFLVLLRNLSNRVFDIDQIDIGYLDANNGDAFVNFPESPVTQGAFISDGDLTAGEFNFIGYELDNDRQANNYVISYLFSDEQSNTSFRLDGTFDFAQ